jgi:tRNA threonylcarbamoyladenosine biosynthesis protein TsaE
MRSSGSELGKARAGSALKRGKDRRNHWQVITRSVMATTRLGQCLGQALVGGEVIGLSGDLGTGKTVLVKGIARGLGIEERSVTSPTFVLVQEYEGRLRLVHADLYRLRSVAECATIGLSEYVTPGSALTVEWVQRGTSLLPPDHLMVVLSQVGPRARRLEFGATGPQSARLLARVRTCAQRRQPIRRVGRRTRRTAGSA